MHLCYAGLIDLSLGPAITYVFKICFYLLRLQVTTRRDCSCIFDFVFASEAESSYRIVS